MEELLFMKIANIVIRLLLLQLSAFAYILIIEKMENG